MPTPTNLYQYYTGQGQTLPSVQQRQGIAAQAGISGYTGTASQNTQLLNYLQNSTPKPVAPPVMTSPTVVTNANMGQKINGLNNSLTNLNQKGLQKDANGNTMYANGSLYDPVTEASTQYDKTYGDSYDNVAALLKSMQSNLDAQTASKISGINSLFEERRNEVRDLTKQESGQLKNALLMGGAMGTGSSMQYAPISSQGIITANEQYGLKQIRDIDRAEQQYIDAANNAQREGSFRIMENMINLANKKREEKIQYTSKLMEDIAKRNNEARAQQIQATRDSAIADLISQGITDPKQILDYLNNDDQGNFVGDFTAKEVNDTLKNISENLGTDPTKLKNDTDEFFYFSKKGELPPSITKYPTQSEQLLAYVQAKKQSEKVYAPKSTSTTVKGVYRSGGATFTPEQMGDMEKELQASKKLYGGDGQYVNPEVYQQAYDAWTMAGGLGKDFILKFPPTKYVNPTNTTLPTYLRGKAPATTKKTSTGTSVNDL